MTTMMRMCGLTTAAFLLFPVSPSVAQQWSWPEEPENLQVLEGFSGRRLAPVMIGDN